MDKCHAKYLLNTRGILVIRGAVFYFDDIKRVWRKRSRKFGKVNAADFLIISKRDYIRFCKHNGVTPMR